MKNKLITAVYNLTIGYQSVLKITKSPIYILLFCIKKNNIVLADIMININLHIYKRNCK